MKITALITALQRIHKEHGDLTIAEEKPLGWMAMREVEVKQIPQYGAVRNVPATVDALADGQLVVIIKAQ